MRAICMLMMQNTLSFTHTTHFTIFDRRRVLVFSLSLSVSHLFVQYHAGVHCGWWHSHYVLKLVCIWVCVCVSMQCIACPSSWWINSIGYVTNSLVNLCSNGCGGVVSTISDLCDRGKCSSLRQFGSTSEHFSLPIRNVQQHWYCLNRR